MTSEARYSESPSPYEWIENDKGFETVKVTYGITGIRSSEKTDWPRSGKPNIWMIRHGGEAVIVDSAYGDKPEMEGLQMVWEQAQKPHIRAIIATHEHGDHIGGIEKLRELTNPDVVIDPYRFRRIPDTSFLPPFVHIIPTPGHTNEDLSVYVKSKQILLTGDFIVGNGLGTSIGTRHAGVLLGSLEKVEQLNLKAMCPGHGSVIDKPYEKIIDIRSRQFYRMSQVIEKLSETKDPVHFNEIVEKIYPDNFYQGEGQIEAYIAYLLMEEVVVDLGNGYFSLRQ